MEFTKVVEFGEHSLCLADDETGQIQLQVSDDMQEVYIDLSVNEAKAVVEKLNEWIRERELILKNKYHGK